MEFPRADLVDVRDRQRQYHPPIVDHPNQQRKINHVTYMIFTDGAHIHVIAWRQGPMLYWLTNTLLEDLSNEQMLAIARSAHPLH